MRVLGLAKNRSSKLQPLWYRRTVDVRLASQQIHIKKRQCSLDSIFASITKLYVLLSRDEDNINQYWYSFTSWPI